MRTRDERGSLSLEFVLLVPALVLLFGVMVGGARAWIARSGVEQLAAAAARGAALERTPADAESAASRLVAAQLAVGGMRCQPLSVGVDAKVLASASGTPGEVRATISCGVPLGDVLVPGWPGSLEVRATAAAVADRYRERK
jgi:Flp pilus assembly protein TadG